MTAAPTSMSAAPPADEVYTESNECNLVNNGKGDWKIKFDNSGEDLKGALANPACPY